MNVRLMKFTKHILSKNFVGKLSKHPLLITVVAGFITCFIGHRIAYEYQVHEIRYQQDFEIFKERLHGGMALLDDISLAAGERYMCMNRVLWIIKGTGNGDIDKVWDEYYLSVLNWNKRQLLFKARMIQYVGDEFLINRLMSTSDATDVLYSNKNPQSLHGHFLASHKKIRTLYECARHRCAESAMDYLTNEAEKSIVHLGQEIEKFHGVYVKRLYNKVGRPKLDL